MDQSILSKIIIIGLLFLGGLSVAVTAQESVSIHVAVLRGDYDAVERALDAGANPNTYNLTGYAPLHTAALRGDTDIVTLLLDRGARVNISTRSQLRDTALHIAARNSHYDIVEILVARGAWRQKSDGVGNIPAADATLGDDPRVISLLSILPGDYMNISFPVSVLYHQPTINADTAFTTLEVDALARLFVHIGFQHTFIVSPSVSIGYEIGVGVSTALAAYLGVLDQVDTPAFDVLSPAQQFNAPFRLLAAIDLGGDWQLSVYNELLFTNIIDVTSRLLFLVPGVQVATPDRGSGRFFADASYVAPLAFTFFSRVSPTQIYWGGGIRMSLGYSFTVPLDKTETPVDN